MRNKQHQEKNKKTIGWLKRIFIGEPLPTSWQKHEKLPKILALPVFSSDALSSTAYATQEILVVLLAVGLTAGYAKSALPLVVPIGIAIAVLLAIVAMSYRQTIHAYPSGGGAYIVAKDNLGTLPGLIAAASLLIDYVLTVSVSVAAGVDAIISAFQTLSPYRVDMCLFFILFITLVNVRGVRESGMVFAFPTYFFVFCLGTMIVAGMAKFFLHIPVVVRHPEFPSGGMLHPLTLFLILRAFSAGCTALTGIEAISNGIPAFRPPESKNAAATLTIMAAILISLFLGVTFLAKIYHVIPDETTQETVISMLARGIFHTGFFYYCVQFATAMILILAANTSYQDFPRLSAILANDRFMPRQLSNVGDRLVFANGIAMLWAFSSLLIWRFQGSTHYLLPLYAIGVFISFTLSQAGMVKRWFTLKEKGWWHNAIVNGIGAVITGIVAVVISKTKFHDGAYITLILIPILVAFFFTIHHHYVSVSEQLRLDGAKLHTDYHHTVLVLVPGIHRGVLPAIEYAKSIGADCRAIYIELDSKSTQHVKQNWEKWSMGLPLIIMESPYRSLIEPVFKYLDEVQDERENNVVTVVLPEFVPARWWHSLLHNQSGFLLKVALLFKKGIVVTNIRYQLSA